MMGETITDSIYPLTVTADRYRGAYSDGKFLAWNLEPQEIPEEIFGDDVECMRFWCENENALCGKGKTIEEAIANLYIAIKQGRSE